MYINLNVYCVGVYIYRCLYIDLHMFIYNAYDMQ